MAFQFAKCFAHLYFDKICKRPSKCNLLVWIRLFHTVLLLLPFNLACVHIRRCTYYSTHDLPGNVLTLDDLGLLLEELTGVCERWYPLGLQLKVRPEMLDRIREQFHDPTHQLLEMLKTWLSTSDNTSWKTLTDTLKSRSVGCSATITIMKSKYRYN